MFGINDNKAAGQDPVMPPPLGTPEPDANYGSPQDAGTAPPLASSQPLPLPTPVDYTAPVIAEATQAASALPAAPYQPAPYSPVVSASKPDIPTASDSPPSDELLKIKLEALHNLAPLVDKLDQTPEEKFKTTMMMLQASDNPELVKAAYAAANEITDEKARAQALLDVVNEINYFTHPGAA